MNLVNWVVIAIHVLVAVIAAGHALLFKRDPRSALGWIAVTLIFPLFGPLLYFLFGINRVRTRARKMGHRFMFHIDMDYGQSDDAVGHAQPDMIIPQEFAEIARVSDAVTRRPLVDGNRVELLNNGEQAYPAMIETIENANRSCFMATYIFETNRTGRQFVDALARVAGSGVDVRVLIDGVGELYGIPRAGTLLKKRNVRVARFLPPKLLPPSLYINLRNHRKILVADGRVGFVGGMNIGDRHLAENRENPSRVVDMHFRLTGPVVAQIEQVFLEDWRFSTGEQTAPPVSSVDKTGDALCRTIVEGPNEDLDKLATILLGAVNSARHRIFIMTPYFIPSRELIAALGSAALRGVDVFILLPSKNNLPFVQWATTNMLWELLQRGVRVFYQPPPFVHTKLFIVDDYYAQVGSANIDPRSLRLNFELAVEIFDKPFTQSLTLHMQQTIERSREIFLKDVDTRPLAIRTRDALAWLFSPYL